MKNPKAMIEGGDSLAVKLRDEARGVIMPTIPGMTTEMAQALLDLIAAESALEVSQFKGLEIPDAPFTPQDIALGEALFSGAKRCQANRPACLACHTTVQVSGLGGGRLGPDLSRAFERLQGRKGLASWLSAPATPTMRAGRLARYAGVEHGEWKFLMWDVAADGPKMPKGSAGFRWGKEAGKWNLELTDGLDGSQIEPQFTLLGAAHRQVAVHFDDFAEGRSVTRGVPAREVTTADGRTVLVTTVFDLMMAQYGVDRGLGGSYPKGYDDEEAPYTPAWSERYTGIGRDTLIRFAREWGRTAEHTNGKCTIIIGAGINHWYHGNLMYRAGIHALMLCGCVGVNGGGLAHYVGQEKLAPAESWAAIAFARDWVPAVRQQNAPSWHYVHSDQWRYETAFTDYHTVPDVRPPGSLAGGHTMDLQARAVRCGWLPFYPQFDANPLDVARAAVERGATGEAEVARFVVDELRAGRLNFAVDDPDNPSNWPRVFIIWRGNALMSSAKGHEYFLKHYLGTHDNAIAEEIARDDVKEVSWRDVAPRGKMDLVVDLNFRMGTSALYSDIVLPAATWYEKADLNSTDMRSFIHSLSPAVPPCWESKSDWQIFRALARKISAIAPTCFPEPVTDVVVVPLGHDSPAELPSRSWPTGGPARYRPCPASPCRTSSWCAATTVVWASGSTRSVHWCVSKGWARMAPTTRSMTCTTRSSQPARRCALTKRPTRRSPATRRFATPFSPLPR